MRVHVSTMRPYIHACTPAEALRKEFSVVIYSSLGTDVRLKEEATYLMFLDLLEECEGKCLHCSGMWSY